MSMTAPILFTLFAASIVAMAFAYSALPSQRWWRQPLRQAPARATAILAALVALRGWIEVLGLLHGGLAWLSTLAVPLAVLFLADTRRTTPRDSVAAEHDAKLTRSLAGFQPDILVR